MTDLARLSAILFDLDGTLRDSQPTGHEVFWEFVEGLGVPGGLENRRRAQRWAFEYWADSDHLLADLKTFGDSRDSDAFWKNYTFRHLEALGCTPQLARELGPQVSEHMRESYQPEDVILPGVIQTLEALQETGVTLGVVTNRSTPVGEYLEEIGLSSFFEFSLAGGEVDSWKPKPHIFEAAMKRAGSAPEETLYVGDNYYADVLGARNVGIHPILVDPWGIFPDADCPVVRNVGELRQVLFSEATT